MPKSKIELSSQQLAGATWRKSSKSGPWSDNCVEVAFIGGTVAVRDSKDPNGPVLTFDTEEWGAFTGGVSEGELTVA